MADFKLSKVQYSVNVTPTAGATLTLVKNSAQLQIFTGSLGHTVKLPDATTTSNGKGISFSLVNNSTGSIIVQLNDASTLMTLTPNSAVDLYLGDVSTTNGTWRAASFAGTAGSGVAVSGVGSTINTAARGFHAGGDANAGGSYVTTMNYANFNSNSNFTSFGGLTLARRESAAFGNATKSLWAGGYSGTQDTTIDYIFVSSLAAATSFGSLLSGLSGAATCANATLGFISTNGTIQYVTFATTGNSVSFGSMSLSRSSVAGIGNTTRGLSAGGYTGSAYTNSIEYFTLGTSGSGSTFGTLSLSRTRPTGCGNATRGIFAGGDQTTSTTFVPSSFTNVIEYVTFATLGNTTNFGNLLATRTDHGSCSSPINGIFLGGYTTSIISSAEQINIPTTANSVGFGSLTYSAINGSACSNAHGGL